MREIRSSGSAEGVMGNCDPYSDSPEPVVVKQPKFTRVEGVGIVMQSSQVLELYIDDLLVSQDLV